MDALNDKVAEVKFRENSTVSADWVNGKLHFTFRDGSVMHFNPALVARANRDRAELHGWEQRLRDSMAGAKLTQTERKANLKRLLDHYASGSTDWSPTANRSSAPDPEMILLAISRVFGEGKADSLVNGVASKRGITREEALQVWATSDKVAAEIVVIRSERVKSEVSADDLVAEAMQGA